MRGSGFVALLFVTFLCSCDQLSATMQGVSVLTKAPDLATAGGMDPALTDVLPFDDMPSQKATLIAVGLAEKESPTSTAAPTPVTGAQVFLAWETSEVKACEKSDSTGTYAATSLPLGPCASTSLAYVQDVKYVTRIETGTDVYTINTTPPPPVDASKVTFSPALDTSSSLSSLVVPHHELGLDLTIDWSADAAANENHAFVVLARMNFEGNQANPADVLNDTKWKADDANPVFDNTPREPGEMLALILNEPVSHATIPGPEALDVAGMYVLVLTSAKVSQDVSSNLALGSGGLAGAGVAFLFWVD